MPRWHQSSDSLSRTLALTALSLWLSISCSSASAAELLKTPSERLNNYSFVVLGDSQFHQPENFNRLVNDVALLQPDFVVQVGDMIQGYGEVQQARSEWQRFQRQIAPLGDITFIPVPGNHDVLGPGKIANNAMAELYKKTWGADYTSFKYQKALMVVLNTDVVDEPNQIAGAQLRWLVKTLEANRRAQPKFVFLHKPPALLANADEFHTLMRNAKVDYVIYGHHHHLHHTERDGVTYIMTNAAANSIVAAPETGSFNHFLQVNVREQQTSVAVVKADAITPAAGFDPWDNYDMVQVTRRLAPASITLTADPASQKFRLEIPLKNDSKRTLSIYPNCFANDNRWQFEPARLAPVTLAPEASQTVTLTTWQQPVNSSESTPSCELVVPFQTRNGEWIQHRHSLTSDLPQ